MREKENYRSDPSYSIKNRKFRKKKKSKKIEKIDMHNSGFISSQNRSGQVEKERKKFIAPILPTRPWIENSKKIAKKLKNTIQAWFQAKTGRERGKKKIYPS